MRLVDVGAALSGRTYVADDALVLDVRDAFCPWNEGRWRLEAGEAARTDAEADLALDVSAPASPTMLGHTAYPANADGDGHSASFDDARELLFTADEDFCKLPDAALWDRCFPGLRLAIRQLPATPLVRGLARRSRSSSFY